MSVSACVICRSPRVAPVDGPLAAWRYLRCDACGHRWLHPAPTADELRDYYNGAYRVPRERYVSRVKGAYPALRAQLAEAGHRTGSMLEIGCSYGEMLASFQADGWQVTGIEIDRRACAEAAARLGGRVHCGALDDFVPAAGERFDVVTAFHVIEHVLDPRAFVARALSLLNPGGVLLFKTPNAASLASRIGAGWWEWAAPPEHVHLFSPRSMVRLLGDAGAGAPVLRSQRGDANALLFESARSAAKRLSSRPAGAAHYAPGTTPMSQRGWYRAIVELDALIETPLDALLSAASSGERQLGAELTVLARSAG